VLRVSKTDTRRESATVPFRHRIGIRAGAYAAVLGALIVTYVITPFTPDIRIFFSAAKWTADLSNFPFNLDQIWEIKPVGNRFIFYALYRFTTLFVDYQEKVLFEIAVKAIVVALSLIAIAAFAYGARDILRKYQVPALDAFFLTAVGFFSISTWSAVQAEHFGLLLVLVAFPLALSRYRGFNLLSGALLALLFTIKGFTLLLALGVYLVLYAVDTDYRRHLAYSAVGLAIALAAICYSFLFIFPYAIPDAVDGVIIQSSFQDLDPLTRLWDFVGHLFNGISHIPILLPGVVAAVIALPFLIVRRQWRYLLAFSSFWAIGCAITAAQGHWWYYHYFPLTIAAVLSILFFAAAAPSYATPLTERKKILLSAWALGAMAAILIFRAVFAATDLTMRFHSPVTYGMEAIMIGFAFLLGLAVFFWRPASTRSIQAFVLAALLLWVSFSSPIGTEFVYTRAYTAHEFRVMGEVQQSFRLSAEPDILYMDFGTFGYYFESPSHCRYFAPVPVQRVRESRDLYGTPLYNETFTCIQEYRGEYILLQPGWFGINSRAQRHVREKLKDEYQVVYRNLGSDLEVLKRRP
jgi:hypothetical protein